MQLLPILLLAVVMAVDGGLRPLGAGWNLSHASVALITWGPMLLIVLATTVILLRCRNQLDRGRFPRPLFMAERTVRIARIGIVINHITAVLVFDWLGVIRSVIGNTILLDEFLAILPPLVGIIATWWAWYPIERRLRDALLIRRLDEGRTIYPIPTRRAWVMLQVRLNLLLLLVPILGIVGMSEAFHKAAQAWGWSESHRWVWEGGRLLVAAGVFLLAPLGARLVLDVQAIAPGPLRETLLDVCRRHRVRVRELLLWNTNGSMINAAVMGLIGPLRYVMITDFLLDTLREDEVRAVMAHEIGHVRRHHLPWLVGCLMASFALTGFVVELPLWGAQQFGWKVVETLPDWAGMIAAGLELGLGLMVFGWICRRFERQADTFAVQHLSGMGQAASAENGGAAMQTTASHLITPTSVDAMRGALLTIAEVNTIELDRRSWRHGSIAWRIDYLISLIGRPVMKLPIDRVVRRIKIAVAVVLIAALALWLLDGAAGEGGEPKPDATAHAVGKSSP